MSSRPGGFLLDTCAAIWFANGGLAEKAKTILAEAASREAIYVSPVSAWEVGTLAYPRSGRPKVEFLSDPMTWFTRLMAARGIRAAHLTATAALDASRLPGDIHADPADRLLISTARELNLPLVTRDRKILDYAASGHVQALAC